MTALESRVHARSLLEFGARTPNSLVLSGDLTSSTEADDFMRAYPERFLSMGMAEQNMMSVAGGLAREGWLPMVHTFAVFMYRRALDQIEMSIAYPNLPVMIVGFLPGITTPGGVSHQAINDVAVLRSVPNMHILETGDVTEVEGILDVAASLEAPVYLRMIRGAIPRLFDTPFRFNTARVLTEGKDLLILSSGVTTETTMQAVEVLKQQGVGVTHLHISTLKPFTDPRVLEELGKAQNVITVENHSIIGGLGSSVAELIAEHQLNAKLHRIGLNDTYAHGASKEYLMWVYGLDADAVVSKAAEVLDLDTAKLVGRNTTAQAQAPAEPVTTPDEAL